MSSGTGQRFSLSEIQYATKDFDDDLVIGQGGFGKVYKGQLSTEEGGHVVAIKRLSSMSSQGEPEFKAEIETLSELRHCHLVSLIGYCDENKEMILVYEYMPNGTLYHHLHKSKTILGWVQRMKIAIGAGRGLDYLHTGVGTEHGIIHRDVKSSNILLDDNMAAKISDFGLSKIGPTNQSSSWVNASVKGTFGYLDPEYFYTRKLSRKTDVYAFGVVLFELLTGRHAVDERNVEEECNLVRWTQKYLKQRKLDHMVDSNIKGTIFHKCLRRFAQIAERCVHNNLKERPTMSEVVGSLQGILELQLKFDNSTKSSGIMGFSWRTHKYFPSATKKNSDQSGTSSPNPGNGMVHEDVKEFTFDKLKHSTMNLNQTWLDKMIDKEVYKDEGGTSSPNPVKDMVLEDVKDIKEFTYDELKRATRNFNQTLGKRNHIEVYKGWVDKLTYSPCDHNFGLLVAVKRFRIYKYFHWEMLKECNHPNLVKLIGYCTKIGELFIVYEFMHNGNFEDLLRGGVVASLPLVKKVQIAFGVARGFLFLQKMNHYFGIYHESKLLIDRRNIMLDEDFVAKLSDYGGAYKQSQSHKHHTTINFGDHVSLPSKFLQMDLSGFTVIFAEVVTGRHIFYNMELDIIDHKFLQNGNMSMRHIAKLCFKSCYEVECESKMLEILREYDTNNLLSVELDDDKFNIATLDEHEDDTCNTSTLDELDDDILSTSTLDECDDDILITIDLDEHQDDTFKYTETVGENIRYF